MNANLTEITKWLLDASADVGANYFQPRFAGDENRRYRERVYCYELYHQWRSRWTDRCPYSLSGEIDKATHRLIPTRKMPDFVVHIPGEMTNLLIVEVKAGKSDDRKMVDDLAKLTMFRRDFEYQAAYFWIYGIKVDEWSELKRRLIEKSQLRRDVDLELIRFVIHGAAGKRASFDP